MNKVKEFIKKYHIIPYVIIMLVIVAVAFTLKWHHSEEVTYRYGVDNATLLYRYFNILLGIILVGVSVLYYIIFIRKAAVEKIYLAAAIFTGVMFMLVLTPFSSADEDNHYIKCASYVGLELPFEEADQTDSEMITNRDLRDIKAGNYIWFVKNIFADGQNNSGMVFENPDIDYTDQMIVFYFPAVIGMAIAKGLGLGVAATCMIARIFMLTVYCLITYFAIKKVPVWKPLFAVIMLMPSVMQRVSTVTHDAVIFSVVFLFIAYIIRFAHGKDLIRPKDAVIMTVAGMLIAIARGGAYIPLLLLLFLIPKECFGKKVKYRAVVVSAMAVAAVAFLIGNPGLLGDVGASNTSETLSWIDERSYTLKDVISKPVNSVRVLINTLYLCGGKYLTEMIGNGYGWLQIYTSEIWVVAYAIIIMTAILNYNSDIYFLGKKNKVIATVSVVFSTGLILLSMWICWTPISYGWIAGVQGRYFIPLLIPLCMILKSDKMVIKPDVTKIIIFSSIMIHVFTYMDIWLLKSI